MATRSYFLLNILAFGAVLGTNYLANALPLHGKTTGELSSQYPNLFVPAGLTFSIWGIIYLWLLAWVVVQAVALFHEKTYDRIAPGIEKIGVWFAGTCVLNIAWLFAWHWEILPVSVAVMVALLAVLWRLNIAAEVGFSSTNNWEKWLAHAPFGLYQGWITVALIANVTALLVSVQWGGFGIAEATWAIVMIIIGTLLATTIVRGYNNVFHGLAVAWALYGIYLKRNGDAADMGALPVGTVALAGIALILLWVVVRWRYWADA
ncbi:MAG: hypothetical protein IPM98_17645 [Lewinellaceae bacterium]|nr:hypothetical protein [Lewinellaceae bacterium]